MPLVTTLLIVLTLSGGPVASAVCVAWCDEVPASGEAPCHKTAAQPMSAAISDGSDVCVQLLSDTPFVREDDRAASKSRTATAQGDAAGLGTIAHAAWYSLPDETLRGRGSAPPSTHHARAVPIYIKHLALLI